MPSPLVLTKLSNSIQLDDGNIYVFFYWNTNNFRQLYKYLKIILVYEIIIFLLTCEVDVARKTSLLENIILSFS